MSATGLDPASSSSTFDRWGPRRGDDAFIESSWADPDARVVLFSGSRFAAAGRRPLWLRPEEAPGGVRVLLGAGPHGPRFAVLGAREVEGGAHTEWIGLRDAFGSVGAEELGLLVHAVGLAEWHRAYRHCPACGGELHPREAGNVLRCASCGRDQFPRTDAAVIMLITDSEDRALLGRQPSWPEGRWSTLAGFVEPGETLEDAVRREVFEEAGVLVGEVTYAGSQPWPLPASLMLGFTGKALSTDIEVDGQEIQDARWWSREDALAAAQDGSLVVPPGISISRSLITGWYGDDLPGSWT
ncbi:MAG: NAD(+) diphosphatase [Marmoricola sp.]